MFTQGRVEMPYTLLVLKSREASLFSLRLGVVMQDCMVRKGGRLRGGL